MNTQKILNRVPKISKLNKSYTIVGHEKTHKAQDPHDLVAVPKSKEVDVEE